MSYKPSTKDSDAEKAGGMYLEGSMEKETRLKEKAAEELAASHVVRESSMHASTEEFNSQVSYIRRLQAKTEARQKIMAQLAVELFSSLTLQMSWRCKAARTRLRERKYSRLLVHWSRYYVLYRCPRLRAARLIRRAYRLWRDRKVLRAFARYVVLVARTQRWWRSQIAIRTVCRRRVVCGVRDAVLKRVFVFASTRACNKIIKRRLLVANQQAHLYSKAVIIIRFFRKCIMRRLLQLLTAYAYSHRLEHIRVMGSLSARAAIDIADPTFVGRLADERRLNGETAAATSTERGRRGGVAPMKRPTLISGKIAKNQPTQLQHQAQVFGKDTDLKNKVNASVLHEQATFLISERNVAENYISVPWRNHLKPHAQVLLYVLSRLRPYAYSEFHAGGGGHSAAGQDHAVSTLFAYLVRKRHEHFSKMQRELDEINSFDAFKRRIVIRHFYLREGMLGHIPTKHLLLENALLEPDASQTFLQTVTAASLHTSPLGGASPAAPAPTAPTAPTLTSSTATATATAAATTGVPGPSGSAAGSGSGSGSGSSGSSGSGAKHTPRRGGVSSDEGISGTVGANAAAITGARHRQISIINKSPRQRTLELVHELGARSGSLPTSSAGYKSGTIGVGEQKLISRAEQPWSGSAAEELPFPREFNGIYRPTTIFEMVTLIFALRDMVIAMPCAEFDQVVGAMGHRAEEIAEDGSSTQDCLIDGESTRLGALPRGVIQHYVQFTQTSKLLPASKALLRDTRQMRRITSRAADVVQGAVAVVEGRHWAPTRSLVMEEAEEAAEAMSRFYSRPPAPGEKKIKSNKVAAAPAALHQSTDLKTAAHLPNAAPSFPHKPSPSPSLLQSHLNHRLPRFDDSGGDSNSNSEGEGEEKSTGQHRSKPQGESAGEKTQKGRGAKAGKSQNAKESKSKSKSNSDTENENESESESGESKSRGSRFTNPAALPAMPLKAIGGTKVKVVKSQKGRKTKEEEEEEEEEGKDDSRSRNEDGRPKQAKAKAVTSGGADVKRVPKPPTGKPRASLGKKAAPARAEKVPAIASGGVSDARASLTASEAKVAGETKVEAGTRAGTGAEEQKQQEPSPAAKESGRSLKLEPVSDLRPPPQPQPQPQLKPKPPPTATVTAAATTAADTKNRRVSLNAAYIPSRNLSPSLETLSARAKLETASPSASAREQALKVLGIDLSIATPDLFSPDFSLSQYSSEFTRSALLHWQISREQEQEQEPNHKVGLSGTGTGTGTGAGVGVGVGAATAAAASTEIRAPDGLPPRNRPPSHSKHRATATATATAAGAVPGQVQLHEGPPPLSMQTQMQEDNTSASLSLGDMSSQRRRAARNRLHAVGK